MGVRWYLLIALMMVVVSSDNVCAMQSNETLNEESDNDNNDSKEGITGDNLSKELNFAIRATVPSSICIEVVKGSDGIDLFDDKGKVKQDSGDRSFVFRVDGSLRNITVSFSGKDGLVLDENGWKLLHKNREGVYLPIVFDLYDKKNKDLNTMKLIKFKRSRREPLELTVVSNCLEHFTWAGDYYGVLVVKVSPAD